jgi:hypothetical protein
MSLQISEHIEQLQPVRWHVTCTLEERRSVISMSLSYYVFFQTLSKIKEIWYGSLKPIKIKNEKGGFAFYIETFTISCGLNLSQNHPRITPSNSQKTLMVNSLAILNPTNKSISAVIAG